MIFDTTLDYRALLPFTAGAFKETAHERDYQNFQKSEKKISPGTEGALIHTFIILRKVIGISNNRSLYSTYLYSTP